MSKFYRSFCCIAIPICMVMTACSPMMYLEDWGIQTDGRVKTELRDYEFTVSNDTLRMGRIRSKFTLFYDKKGRPTEIWHWGKSETDAVIKEKFLYDQKHRTITYASFRKGTILEFRIVYSFNRKMQQTGHQYYDKDSVKGDYTKQVFEPNKRDYTTYSYDETHVLKDKSFTQRNKKGQITKQMSFNDDGSLSAYSDVLYDKKGREASHIWYRADGTLKFGTRNIKYNRRGEQVYAEDAKTGGIQTSEAQRRGDTVRTLYFSDSKARSIEDAIITYR